jgi:hypothetical protein
MARNVSYYFSTYKTKHYLTVGSEIVTSHPLVYLLTTVRLPKS